MPFRLNLEIQDTNVTLTWPAEVAREYTLEGSTNLNLSWQALFADRFVSPLNQVIHREPLLPAERFFRVGRFDTAPPTVCRLSPSRGAVAVSRTNSLDICISDETAVDTNELTLVLNGQELRLDDPRLTFRSGLLSYRPGPNDFLGAFGSPISASLLVSDTAGNTTNVNWTFELELAPVVATNVINVAQSPAGLALVATNSVGDIFTYSFVGASSGLVPGMIVVSADPNFLYRRRVLTATESNDIQRVEVVTTNASLADCLKQGSIQLQDDFSGASFEEAPHPPSPLALAGHAGARVVSPMAACCSVNLSNRVLLATQDLTAEVLSGQISLAPLVAVRGNFGASGLLAMDAEFGGQLVLDLIFHANARAAGGYTNRTTLGSARKLFPLDLAGSVPAWAEAQIDFQLGFESFWQSPGTITAGVRTTNELATAAMLRSGIWTSRNSRLFRYEVPIPAWENNLTAQVRVYLDVTLTLRLDGLPGPRTTLRSALEANGVGCMPPGHAGFDLFLHDAFTEVLAVEVPGWDRQAPVLAATNVFDERQPIYHTRQARRIGPALRPIGGMVWIPCGRFGMGQPAPMLPPRVCDCPLTEVTLNQGFFMGRHEVTQGEFIGLLTNNPSFHHGGIWGTNTNRPVENVSWHEATNYCALLTARERRAGRLPFDFEYRLPTEAEWEYACRSGTTTSYHYGEALRAGMAAFDCGPEGCETNAAWAYGAPGVTIPQSLEGGLFAPNLWDLQDMHGNVAEWCLDWLGDQLPGVPVVNPIGRMDASVRAVRGGSFSEPGAACTSSTRASFSPGITQSNVGFRVVLASVSGSFADLAIALVAATNAEVDATLSYSIEVRNLGSATSSNVTLIDVLPPNVAFISATAGCTNAAGTVNCALGDLLSNGTAGATITVRPSSPGLLTNTVTANSDTADPNPTNNIASALTFVAPPARADLQLHLTSQPTAVQVGQALSYFILVTNVGPGTATNVMVTNTLSAKVTFMSASDARCSNMAGTVYCLLGDLPSASAATITIVVQPSAAGILTNTALVWSDTLETNLTDNLASTFTAATPAGLFVDYTTTLWRFLADGTDQGTAWRQPNFDDSTWPLGQGLFGFDGDSNSYPHSFQTYVAPPSDGGPRTTYFRTRFSWFGSTNAVTLLASNLVDDGLVCYLNGAEVGRIRLPNDPDFLTPASGEPPVEGEVEPFAFAPANLVVGDNVLAVELHQVLSMPGNGDGAFGLTLSVSNAVVPRLTIAFEGNRITISWTDARFALQQAEEVTGPWSDVPGNPLSPYVTDPTEAQRFFRLRKGP